MKMRIPEYQFFSNDEYKQRMDALRARIGSVGATARELIDEGRRR